MPKKKAGSSIKDPELYEELRAKGDSRQKAARIANAAAKRGRSALGRKGGRSEKYEEWTVPELRDKAKEIGIAHRSGMRKSQLIDALRHH
ncbi:MAG TPA: Rho termination factor N-terminal domain-containing protein [Gammaproteobacteria bacterium]|nr:Rho termination factor N-terminal domain-containing protein [Gammaproteobacteria bacterium]